MSQQVVKRPETLKESNDLRPTLKLLEMISGNWVSQSVYAAAKLGIADLLKDGPQNIDELAQATGADVQSLYRLMRALASVDVFTEVEDKHFWLTPIGECLQTENPNSLRFMAILFGEVQYQAWADIVYSVKTGKCAYEHQNGISFFHYLEQNAEAAQTFNKAMTNFLQQTPISVADAYDFSGFNKVVDVGGGHGSLISSILSANPKVRGVLFDAPHVIEGAKEHIQAAELSDRCELVSGDFFKSVPSGGDAYILSTIIHDWDDDSSIAILKNCHDAMVENGKLLLVEMVILPGNEPFFGKLLDLHMLIMHGGHDRTEAEYGTLLAQAGFKMTKIITTKSLRSVIEAVRV